MKTHDASMQVLIVDDEPIIRFVLSMIFKKNAVVKTVASAEEAIAELQSQFYDLCFLDIILPGMNGLEAMRIINEISPHTKVAIMTGSSLDEAMKALIADLSYEFVEKPFELSRIREIANSVELSPVEQPPQ